MSSLPAPCESARDGTPSPPREARPAARWLLRGEWRRMALLAGRYPVETAASLATLALVFVAFASLGTLAGGRWSPFTGDARVLAVLYAAWVTASTTIGASAGLVGTDAELGLLEPLFAAALPIVRVMEVRALAQLLQGTVIGAALLAAFCLGTRWHPPAALAVTLLAALPGLHATTLGLALAFTGIALRVRKLGALMMPVNFLSMLALMGGPSGTLPSHPAWAIVPYEGVALAVRQAYAQGRVAWIALGVGTIVGVACLGLGHRLLARSVQACRRRGNVHMY